MKSLPLLMALALFPTLALTQPNIVSQEPLTCLLNPNRVSEIGSDRVSIVRNVPVERAQFVRKGDVLVQLDDAFLQSDRGVAEITHNSLVQRLERASKLIRGNLISLDEIEEIRTELAVAGAKLSRTDLEIARAQVTAPFDGFVADIQVSEGELIGSESLLTLVELTRLKTELVYLAESYGEVSKGDTLKIIIDQTGTEAMATVTSIDPFFDASSNTFSVFAVVENDDLTLPAGANCRVIQ
ncbi:efflux RND transporter periplasmic adaptor subunit [Planktotalea sp.]|uniref:efflux RND transporter periplasmic adaptor subunit n=1 Tax=Planktotalea sp. TaxID=2029877 RepID=UPI0025E9EEEA|nr:efflux RND transporter periplasmic adaptor subunit [Planktotalea sp.]